MELADPALSAATAAVKRRIQLYGRNSEIVNRCYQILIRANVDGSLIETENYTYESSPNPSTISLFIICEELAENDTPPDLTINEPSHRILLTKAAYLGAISNLANYSGLFTFAALTKQSVGIMIFEKRGFAVRRFDNFLLQLTEALNEHEIQPSFSLTFKSDDDNSQHQAIRNHVVGIIGSKEQEYVVSSRDYHDYKNPSYLTGLKAICCGCNWGRLYSIKSWIVFVVVAFIFTLLVIILPATLATSASLAGATTSELSNSTSSPKHQPSPPMLVPTGSPTNQTSLATFAPSKHPSTTAPSPGPSISPTNKPTREPSEAPTKRPTRPPTTVPSQSPTISSPTQSPATPSPTKTNRPTRVPTKPKKNRG
jgi:hypothetical protein